MLNEEQHGNLAPAPASAKAPVLSPAPLPAPASVPATLPPRALTRRLVAMTPAQAQRSARLLQVRASSAMLTTFNEIDFSAIERLITNYGEPFRQATRETLTATSFIVRAATQALRRFPALNSRVDGADVVFRDYCDIKLRVEADSGSFAALLRDAQLMSFAEIEQQAARRADHELASGTFGMVVSTMRGALLSNAHLDADQSASLATHAVQQRVVVQHGQIVTRPMMYASLTYDHRVIDGSDAVQFLLAIKNALEQPAELLS